MNKKDNRPPKHLRILRKGDVRDGMVFWCYHPQVKTGEQWLTRETYDEKHEKGKRKGREYRVTNREELKLKRVVYKKVKVESIKKQRHEYRKNNRAKIRVEKAERRALAKKAIHPDNNKEISKTLYALSARLTIKLGIQFHVDHILPYAKGGLNHHCNLKVIPARFNLQKGSNLDYQLPECWNAPRYLIN